MGLFILEDGFELELSVFPPISMFLYVKSKEAGNILYRSISIKNKNNDGFKNSY